MLLLGHLNPPVHLGGFGSATPADRPDQIPLAHLRPPGDVSVLGDLVQLLAIAVFKRATRFSAALTSSGSLLSELATRALRELGDRALPARRLLCLLDVLLRGLHLPRRSHPGSLPSLFSVSRTGTRRMWLETD